ncbi:MAG: FG-GAP repeat domain-containing protein, partial [Candidatus Zipacnadales bacterium]
DRTTLTAWGVDNGHLVARWSVSGADLTASGVGETDGDRGSEVLVGTRGVSHAPPVKCRGVASHQLGRHFLERCDTSPIIVAQPGTRERLVVVETALENVVAFCPSENGSLKVRWQVPGRGMTDSYDPRFGVAAADLLEEPGAEIIVARRSPTGCAQLAVLSSVAGHTLWTHDFPHIPGAPPPWNVGGLVFWQPLHGSQGPAVFVSVRRSTMHSCEGLLLDGKTGRVVWHQRGLEPPVAHDRRGYGGKLVAATDLDADGTDEIICCYPDMAWIADSSSGAIRHMLNTADGTVFGGWTAYATPIVADFMGNGSLQILWGGCTYVTGLLDRELQRLWAGSYANAYGRQDVCIQGMGDFEGSGSMQIVERQSNGRLACLAGATGTERWSIPFGVIRGSIVSCDIDSDGQDEALAVSNQELICVGWGKEEWRIPLPAQGFTPAIGDVDGDGRSEILVALRNGDIVCIGGA